MFPFRKRSRLGNSAEMPIIRPIENTITHNYGSSRIGTIFAVFAVIVLSAVLLWHGLVFLLGQYGAARPTVAAAECLLGGAVILFILTTLGLLARYILRDFYAHRDSQAAYAVELEKAKYSSVQLIPPTTAARMTKEESRRYLAVKMVMAQGYELIDEEGNLTTSVEPWSRRTVGKIKLTNEKEEIGENTKLASWVKTYLIARGILVTDRKVNIEDFPNLASVEAQLVKDFGTPIVYSSGDPDAGMSTQYVNKGGGGGSWSN